MANPFQDQNPYEPPPIVAQLADRGPAPTYQPPQPKKPWPPIFAILWLVAGPFIWFEFMRYCIDGVQIINERDNLRVGMMFAMGGILWLLAGIRVLIWTVRSLIGY